MEEMLRNKAGRLVDGANAGGRRRQYHCAAAEVLILMENIDKYVGQIIDRRYKLNKVIGIGGMAVVFEAQDLVLKRAVAVKMIKDEIANDTPTVKRFINESKAVSMLSHPNIVSIYDVSVKDDLKYIVMEYVAGITLKNYMEKKGALGFKETDELRRTDTARAGARALKGDNPPRHQAAKT